jgi:hypothetical protein
MIKAEDSMRRFRELDERRRLAYLDRWMRRTDPALVAEFSRSLSARRRMFSNHRWARIGLAALAFCYFAGIGTALGIIVGIAPGVLAAALPALALTWYLTRVPMVRERRIAAPPIRR